MAINDNTSYELFGYQVKELATKINSKAEAASLAPVATSGLYSDLIGAPTVPTVYNGALAIQQNGTTLDTFTANSPDDKTVNIQTITAETVTPVEEVGAIKASMIDWSTMFTNKTSIGNSDVTFTNSEKNGNVALTVESDSTGKVGRISGKLSFHITSVSSNATASFQTNLRPDAPINITSAGVMIRRAANSSLNNQILPNLFEALSVSIAADGIVAITLPSVNNSNWSNTYCDCIMTGTIIA